jgi:transcriptional regulator with XRE-family HTH domain
MTTICPKCCGTGFLPDQEKIGAELRALRIERKKSLRSVAKRMGFTAPYVSDLELGKRRWSADLINQFKKAIR